MVQAIQAADVTLEDLEDLEEKFGLRLVQDAQFFPEWMSGTEQITDTEKAMLDRVQANFLTLLISRVSFR